MEIPVEQGTILLLSIDAIHTNRALFWLYQHLYIYLTHNFQPVIGPIHMSLNHHGSWMGTEFITPELSCRFQLVYGHVLAVGSWLGVAVVFDRLWFPYSFAEVELITAVSLIVLRYKVTVLKEARFAHETPEMTKARVLQARKGLNLQPARIPLSFARRDWNRRVRSHGCVMFGPIISLYVVNPGLHNIQKDLLLGVLPIRITSQG